ncbi:class I SAM-dependent methyltransferase [bacterium]|nr:class I SAM-dependent methyltransferase [bacterium]
MAEITQGLRAVLNHPAIYGLFQWAVGANRLRRHIARLTLDRGVQRLRVLDVGCGPADLLDFLPNVDYVGFDPNPDYVAAARRRFGDHGTFFQQQLEATTSLDHGTFDRVLAVGLLHHLDDPAARHLFALARGLLRPGGCLVTVDACYAPDQHWLARWLIARDRGQNVRHLEGYRSLAESEFPECQAECRHNLLNIPYTHALLRCSV